MRRFVFGSNEAGGVAAHTAVRESGTIPPCSVIATPMVIGHPATRHPPGVWVSMVS